MAVEDVEEAVGESPEEEEDGDLGVLVGGRENWGVMRAYRGDWG